MNRFYKFTAVTTTSCYNDKFAEVGAAQERTVWVLKEDVIAVEECFDEDFAAYYVICRSSDGYMTNDNPEEWLNAV